MTRTPDDCDVVIVGGGPAGTSAALQIADRDPSLAQRTLLLDKATFPRAKLCGGGVVRQADRYLGYLGVRVDVPSVPIHTLRFEYLGGHSLYQQPNAFRVVRREDFDQALVMEVKARGVAVHEGEVVRELHRCDGGIRVVTNLGNYHAKIIIGADGANSLVRRSLVPSQRKMQRFVALEVFTPRTPSEAVPELANTAVFDFRPAAKGLRGYYWDFPSLQAGELRMNRGIGGNAWPADTSLRTLLDVELYDREFGRTNGHLQGATIPMYDPSLPQGAANVLLAGDAVGVDPWLGEGISIAIGTGMLAGHAATQGLAERSFGFHDHHVRIRNGAVGHQLRRNRITSRGFYRAAPIALGLAPWFGMEPAKS